MFDLIAFDADDTLWHNENNFTETQKMFCEMLPNYKPKEVDRALYEVHVSNIKIFGYGIKCFIISMIETFTNLRDEEINVNEIQKILDFGKEMLTAPVNLLPNVFNVLQELSKEYSLILITKGDLIDQEKKIYNSGLSCFFKGIEILSDKTEESYKKILIRYKIKASNFLMVGNSMRSDIVPVVKIGGHAVHIPYATTWEHEKDHPFLDLEKYSVLENIGFLPNFIRFNK